MTDLGGLAEVCRSFAVIINRAVRSATRVGDGPRRNGRTEVRGKNGDKRRPTRDDFRQESRIRDNNPHVGGSIPSHSQASGLGLRRAQLVLQVQHDGYC